MVLPPPLCPLTVPASFLRVTCVIALTLSLGGLAPQLRAQAAQASRSDSASAVATVTRFHDALSARDSVTAVSLLASDAMILESGVIESRADYLGHHLAADMKAGPGAKRTRAVLRVTVLGDAAYVVTKTTTPATNADGSSGSEMAELMVLSKTGSGWTIRAVHWSSRRRRA